MFEQVIWGVALEDILLALSTVAAALAATWVAHVLLWRWVRGLARKSRTSLDDAIVSAVEKPLVAAILAAGLYLASFFLPLLPAARTYAHRGFLILISLLGIYAVLAMAEAFLRWYQLELATRTETGLDDKLVQGLRVAVPLVGLLMAALVALELVGIELAPVKGWLVGHGARLGLIMALAVVAVFAVDQAVPRMVTRIVARGAEEMDTETQKRATTLTQVLATVAQIAVLSLAAFMVLSELGINIGPVLAGLGVAGLAFGFGGQYLVRDLIAGVFIIMENHYRVGDVVKVADVAGVVEAINLRRTVLRDLDGIVHTVPNGEIRVSSNYTRGYSRVNLNISVSYDTDLDRAIAVINRVGKALAEDPQWATLIVTPPQVLRVDNLGDSGIEIKVLGDTQPIQQWAVTGELRKRLKKAFDQEGIEIPWPHTKVYFGNWAPGQK